jgi:hypothetical protein
LDSKLTFSAHIASISRKAYYKSKLISRCFLSKNLSLLKLAFTSYVRPLLEYAIPIWSPYLAKHISIIENVQRRFTKYIPGLFSLPYNLRLRRLDLDTLYHRRNQFDLFICYRIYHSLYHLNSNLFFSRRTIYLTRTNHQKMLIPPNMLHYNVCFHSFRSRVVPVWNSLPNSVVSAGTFSAFKARIKLMHLPV